MPSKPGPKKKKQGLLSFFGIAPVSFKDIGGAISGLRASKHNTRIVRQTEEIFDRIQLLRKRADGRTPLQRAEIEAEIEFLLTQVESLRYR